MVELAEVLIDLDARITDPCIEGKIIADAWLLEQVAAEAAGAVWLAEHGGWEIG